MDSKTVELFRAVEPAEFQDIMASKAFRPAVNGQSMIGKQFGLDLQETIRFADKFPELAAIVKVTIPRHTLDQLDFSRSIDPFIFKSGVATAQPGYQQQLLNATIIGEIEHAY